MKHFVKEEGGATAVEYALMAGLIAAVIATAVARSAHPNPRAVHDDEERVEKDHPRVHAKSPQNEAQSGDSNRSVHARAIAGLFSHRRRPPISR